MSAISDYIDNNWKGIECSFYSSMGLGAYGAAFASVFTPAPITALGFTAIGGAFELAYNLAGCNGDGPLPPPENNVCQGACWKSSTGRELYVYNVNGQFPSLPMARQVVQILSLQWNEANSTWDCRFIYTDGTTGLYQLRGLTSSDSVCARLDGAGACEEESPTIPPPHSPGEPIGNPIDIEIDDCVWTVTPIDAYVDGSGVAHIYYRVTPNRPECGDSYEYWSGPDGPHFVQPREDSDEPTPPPGSQQCPDPCKDYDGQFEALNAKLDQILECACKDEPPVPEGDFRTISFRSDQTSPYGKSRLRKRLRYRSVSSNDLGTVVDHWKDFVWSGGPYRVRWSGGAWGTVEVWAASESEGKRVIQHAAAEAGFSPLEDGRWSTRLTRSSRLGVSSTMRVDTTKGFYWITARDGSDNRPIVAKT